MHFIEKEDSWRVSIKSILKSKNKNFFLTKECRAEHLNERPFYNIPDRYEVFVIIEDDKNHFVRTSCVDAKRGNIKSDDKLKNKKYILEKTNYLSFKEVYEILLLGKQKYLL